jgi:hypothetical protein
MANGCAKDLRQRAVGIVRERENRREVMRLLDVASTTAVRWLDRERAASSPTREQPLAAQGARAMADRSRHQRSPT